MHVDLGLVAAVPGPYQGCYLLAGQPGEFIQQGLGPLILVVVLERSGGQYPGIRPEVEVDRTQCELPGSSPALNVPSRRSSAST